MVGCCVGVLRFTSFVLDSGCSTAYNLYGERQRRVVGMAREDVHDCPPSGMIYLARLALLVSILARLALLLLDSG